MANTTATTKNTRLISILAAATLLLLAPLVAMQFTTGVDWKPLDFVIAAVLLYGTGLACELVMRKVKTTKGRVLVCGAILLALFLVWAELAVGVFGSPWAGS